ncbi:MAG: leucine-rich repeat domain-containing protein [Pseudomonadota bacterium]
MRQSLSLLLLGVVLVAGMAWSGCIEQTPLNLPTRDVCGTPDPGDAVTGDASDDLAPTDTREESCAETGEDTGGETAEDTTEDTTEDTPLDTPLDTPQDTPQDTDPDVCVPDCDGLPCGADDGCGGICQGDCGPGWVCVPAQGACFPDSCLDDQGGFVATFQDAILLIRVNFALGTDGQNGFSWDQVKDMTFLDANFKASEGPIGDLSGLECLINLETLWIAGHADAQPPGFAMDLTPLTELPALTHLDLADDGITDIGPLATQKHLLLLDLGGNSLNDDAATVLATAAFKPGLLALDLSGNNLQNVPDLTLYEDLRILDVGKNWISDLSPLSGAAFKAKLVTLQAEDNWSADPGGTGVVTLSGLEGCFAGPPGPIPDGLADYVQDWRNKLVLYSNRLDSLAGLETMTGLQVLKAGDNLIPDLAPIEGLGLLTELSVTANAITELPPGMDTWAVIPPLVELDISWNPLIDHAPLGLFGTLQRLNIEATELPSLNFMNGWQVLDTIPPIQHLVISYNPLTWSVNGSPMFGLAAIGPTLDTLWAEGVFSMQPTTALAPQWLPDAALIALQELHLGLNGLVGDNLLTFSTAGPEIWGSLIKLFLEDNMIQGGLDQLFPLVVGKPGNPLQILVLTGNPIADCQVGVAAWDSVCANLESALQVFEAPNTCAPCP